ncbi:MAG: HAMP domain-containing sensor histidine kinase, partial [Bacteroidales bacterium]|nr:HAMP domain-containing sensor histidine kinase [Bacteroidales bacterium]
LAVYCIISIYEMFNLNREQKYLKKIFLLNGLFFTIFLLFLVVRLLASFADSTSIFQRSNEGGALFYFISSFVMTALTFGFIGAVNLKLSRDLEGQLKSRMKFFAIIDHDLRGPVGNMMNFLSMMNTRSDLTEEKKQLFLDEMEKLSQSTYHLLQNLLEWASNSKNLSRVEKEKLDVDELVGENYSLFESQCYMKYIKLEYVIEFEGKAYILANKNMMDTVLRNLISNAIKFTNKEGHIRIVSKMENNRVRLTIEDNGVGILSETQDSIFSFNKSKSSVGTAGESGSGLGLAMCKDFVDMNHGKLTVKSEVGKGSQFSVEFQVA